MYTSTVMQYELLGVPELREKNCKVLVSDFSEDEHEMNQLEQLLTRTYQNPANFPKNHKL